MKKNCESGWLFTNITAFQLVSIYEIHNK